MNYRHAYHAGNFADVFKHIIFCYLIDYLKRKATAFLILDTHAGIGLYDLKSDAALLTGECARGIGLMADVFSPEVELILAPYRAVVDDVRRFYGADSYPGSPFIIAHSLRKQDKALCVELHSQDFLTLEHNLVPFSPQIKAIHLDGWTGLKAFIPPPEKRGLVLIDPPFEVAGEMTRLVDEVQGAVQKWQTGMFALWYPIKNPEVTLKMREQLGALLPASVGAKSVCLELMISAPRDILRLNGCGMMVINAPWTLLNDMRVVLPALVLRLSPEHQGFGFAEPLVG